MRIKGCFEYGAKTNVIFVLIRHHVTNGLTINLRIFVKVHPLLFLTIVVKTGHFHLGPVL
jgi:hypothetical protein